MQVGMRVRYIREDTKSDKHSGYYPPVGTLGTVVEEPCGDGTILICWDEGTTDDGIWWCGLSDVEIVKGEE